jgi:single-stranded DNA-binding protein
MERVTSVSMIGVFARYPVTMYAGGAVQVNTVTLHYDVRNQEREMVTPSMPITCYGDMVEYAAALSAGDVAAVEGKLHWRRYKDQHGRQSGTHTSCPRAPSRRTRARCGDGGMSKGRDTS